MAITRLLAISKGEVTIVFLYQRGQEPQVIEAFSELADNPNGPFDQLDAEVFGAVVSSGMTS